MPRLCITGADTNSPDIITYYLSDNFFVLKPLAFARKVLQVIKADFQTFLASVRQFPSPAGVSHARSSTQAKRKQLSSANKFPSIGNWLSAATA